jgi:hypothetical protein
LLDIDASVSSHFWAEVPEAAESVAKHARTNVNLFDEENICGIFSSTT